MSSVSGNMKGFYRQKKTTATKKSSKKSPINAAPSPALISFGGKPSLKDEYEESEMILRQFDLNMTYGPCLGMTRLARWERAHRLGLNPPQEIENLLKCGKVQTESLWNGRI